MDQKFRDLREGATVAYKGARYNRMARILGPCRPVERFNGRADWVYDARRVNAPRPSENCKFTLRANLILGVIREA